MLSAMLDLVVVPASPYLFNARDPDVEKSGGLFSCFVLPMEDSIDSIYNCIGESAKVYQAGGGVGIDFSVLREREALVEKSKGKASGPLSFLNVFHYSACEMTQGGVRRAASIAFMDMDHPDIEDFITTKSQDLPEINRLTRIIMNSTDKALKRFAELQMSRLQRLTSFNLSVKMTDKFMEAVQQNADWTLWSRKTGKPVKTLKARKLFNLVCEYAWKSGDPGVCFSDNVNRGNHLPGLGRIEASNPCGELYMHKYHACNLLAIDLNKLDLSNNLDQVFEFARVAARMAENAIDVSAYPLPEIEETVKKTRGIGIGIMGFADTLIKHGIPYDTDDARNLISEVYRVLRDGAIHESKILAAERGIPDNWKHSIWAEKKVEVRNLWHTTCQPTGSVSIIAGASQSLEPLWNVFYRRRTHDGDVLIELHEGFRRCLEQRGIDIDETVKELGKVGSLQRIDFIPDDMKILFRCAHDISPEDHVKLQARAQEYVDTGISKTINMPSSASQADIAKVYKLAHELGCKGTTVFREGSKTGVLSVVSAEDKYNEELRKWLVTKFCREGLTAREISDIIGVSEQCVFAKLKRYGIRKEEHETALEASKMHLNKPLRDIILSNILVGHSKVQTVDHQSSYRQVTQHRVYAHSVRKKFLDRGIHCGEIMSIVTDETYYYFDTCFMQDIYDLPVDYDSVLTVRNKDDLQEFLTAYFVRHLFLVGGVRTGHGGIKFTSNSRNVNILKRFMELLGKQLEIEVNIRDDSVYIPKNAVEDFYGFLESGEDIHIATEDGIVCPECGSDLVISEKCKTCPNCNWGACSI
jgi:adenosylcobalamin-dependent ribonucleoside-diphosphate reductase